MIRYYYQYSSGRLSVCPLTIHSLLHVVDCIQDCGPVWAYWSFVMERFCSRLVPAATKCRRYPFAAIDNHVVALAQISEIKLRYNCSKQVMLKRTKNEFRTDERIILTAKLTMIFMNKTMKVCLESCTKCRRRIGWCIGPISPKVPRLFAVQQLRFRASGFDKRGRKEKKRNQYP